MASLSSDIPIVALKRGGTYGEGLVEKVRESVDLLGGMGSFVKRGERILVKPNILAGKPPEAAVTTHPEFVRAVIRLVKEAGAAPVVGDSPGIGSARKAAERCGILKVCEEEGVELIELKTPVTVENPGGVFRRFEVADEALKADGIINLPKVKTHVQMYLTLGVKNVFGCVPGGLKAQWHLSAGVDTSHFAGMLLDLYLFLGPRLTIADGIVAMDGNGPGSGDPFPLGLIAASSDAIALDGAVSTILGARPEDLPILKEAGRRGLLTEGSLRGDAPEGFNAASFRFPPLTSLNFASRLPYFIDKRLRKALTSRPRVDENGCTLCSMCVSVCPPEVMRKTTRIEIDYERCIRCYCCQEICPEGAIAPVEGWLKKVLSRL